MPPLCDDSHAQPIGKGNRTTDDCRIVGANGQLTTKALIDLDFGDPKALEARQREDIVNTKRSIAARERLLDGVKRGRVAA
ncbi:hypothetical protein [Candidatus Accumulibacter aalborgensis]|uniref:hypothetical protein n=1 Tax=Candidatus Accumulibacter aalborgensis TaxID=1860102 RepID=UPI0016489922|nr:hypothetical protein [Candidatus Accumulibacter aalborgensis]